MNAVHRVRAYNSAKASENKIHDDAVARRFGFTGGLVPGVDVYAYMAHAPVARFGRAWLERGWAEIRLSKPVYDGEEAVVTADEDAQGGLSLRVESGGVLCATGTARLTGDASAPGAAGIPEPPSPPAHEARPPASESSLATGTLLGMRPLSLTPAFLADYLRDVRETLPVFETEQLAHPGLICRTGNWLLAHNVVLGPWMHVGSTVQNLGLARSGDELTARARVTANYERKGHRFVELDAFVQANNERPVARLHHVAIYRPRQVAE